MSHRQKFRAVFEDAGGGGAYVTIPFDVEQVFGKKRVKVKATIAGEPYRGWLVGMGGACHILGVRKDIRERAGKSFGDEIEVELEEDTEAREVAIPDHVSQALVNDPEAQAIFLQLSYTHQKEYLQRSRKQSATRPASAGLLKCLSHLSKVSYSARVIQV